MEKKYLHEMKDNIDYLIRTDSLTGKAVFAFGHCNATEELIDYLSANKIDVKAILDNNESKLGFVYRSVPVKSPSFIQGYDASNSVVLIASKAFAQMAEQLRCSGYNGEIARVVDYNSFAEYSLSEDTFLHKKERLLRGAATLKSLKEQYPKSHFVICPHNALGDVYWALAFLPGYCRKNRISDVAVLVIGNACRQVAELFQTSNVIKLDQTAMDELVQAVLFCREENCIIAHHDRPYTDNIIRYLDKHELSFIDYFKCGVYGLGKDAEPSLPLGNAAFTNTDVLTKGKTAILSPYAKSVVQFPNTFWESLAENYRQKGYQICTNVIGDEKPITGTQALSVPINQMISAAEYAGLFIGIRSGLCDILTTARCRKVVVFPDCIYSTTNLKVATFFDMPGWEKIIETSN
jgi:hypothetical protein